MPKTREELLRRATDLVPLLRQRATRAEQLRQPGARSILDSDAIQRFHRDTHGASHHFSLSWDAPAEQFGRVALGLPAIP